MRSDLRPFALVVLAAALWGCGGAGSYVWVNDLPPEASPPPDETILGPGDVLAVRVLGHDDLSDAKVRVRDDGRIALPILGEINARGVRPAALRSEIEARLRDYVKEPSVTVNVEESRAAAVSVLGEVSRPGKYPLEPGAGVAQALAEAGGVTEFADRDRLFVIRRGSRPLRVRFTYEAVTRGEPAAAAFALRPGDVVVVE